MDLTDVLVQAMKLEADGRVFYDKMAARVEDAEGKAMFEQLASDEVDHYAYIKRQYEALQAGEEWSAIPEMDPAEALDTVSLVFPADGKVPDALTDRPTEEDALLFGLKIENDSFSLYRTSANQAKDGAARDLFLQLAGAEQRHFEVLMMRYESRFNYPR